MARLAAGPVVIEGGILNQWEQGGDPFKERLQVRQVDQICITEDATRKELLALVRALADDFEPIPSTERVRVTLVADWIPAPVYEAQPASSRRSEPLPIANPERGRRDEKLAELVGTVLHETELAIRQQQWHTVLHNIQAVLRMLPGLGEDTRRQNTYALRRLMTRPVLEALIQQGYRVPEEQPRTADVLSAGGISAGEFFLELLQKSDTLAPHGFLLDALGGMKEAIVLMLPLARSHRAAEARLGAELLGRVGLPVAVPNLADLVQHPDERVRLAAIDGLARYRDKAAVEPLRQALGHPSAAVRARAGRALAARGSGAIAMPLLAALEAEREQGTWEELLGALAGIDAPEAVAALSRIALERRGLFDLGGGALSRRQLAVVRVLTATKTAAAKQALARIAAEGEGEVAQAAAASLTTP